MTKILILALLLSIAQSRFLQDGNSQKDEKPTRPPQPTQNLTMDIPYNSTLRCGMCLLGGYTFCMQAPDGNITGTPPPAYCCQNNSCPQVNDSAWNCSTKYDNNILNKMFCPQHPIACNRNNTEIQFENVNNTSNSVINITDLPLGETCTFIIHQNCSAPAFSPSNYDGWVIDYVIVPKNVLENNARQDCMKKGKINGTTGMGPMNGSNGTGLQNGNGNGNGNGNQNSNGNMMNSSGNGNGNGKGNAYGLANGNCEPPGQGKPARDINLDDQQNPIQFGRFNNSAGGVVCYGNGNQQPKGKAYGLMINKTEGKCQPKMMMIIATNTKNTTSRMLATSTASLSVNIESVDLISSGSLASIQTGVYLFLAFIAMAMF